MKTGKNILLVPPKSLVRYPVAAILSLYASILALYWITPAGPHLFLSIPAIWLILAIDDREEQRKGFFKAYKQIIDQLGE